MNLVLDISTSLEFWRRKYRTDRAPAPPSPALVAVSRCAKTKAQTKGVVGP